MLWYGTHTAGILFTFLVAGWYLSGKAIISDIIYSIWWDIDFGTTEHLGWISIKFDLLQILACYDAVHCNVVYIQKIKKREIFREKLKKYVLEKGGTYNYINCSWEYVSYLKFYRHCPKITIKQ